MERIREIDALRGMSLFGILLVNIFIFHAPYSHFNEFYGAFGGKQAIIVNIVTNFAAGKFLFIFAFLFGFGIHLQRQAIGNSFFMYHISRMLILFFLGVLHVLVFWFGDILVSYALLGMAMLLFLRIPSTMFPFLGIVCLLASPLYYLGCALWEWPFASMGKPLSLEGFKQEFQTGSYLEILPIRLKEFYAFIPENVVWFFPKTLGLFLFGYWCSNKGFIAHLQQNKYHYLVLVTTLLFSFGIWYTIKNDFFGSFDLKTEPLYRPMLIAINIFFESLLGFAYIIGFTLLFQRIKKLSIVFERAGRTALTNYIIQSIICVFVFYGYGFGYYSYLKPSNLVFIATLVYSFNLIFSWFYLRFYKYGPLEYLWRKMTVILRQKINET